MIESEELKSFQTRAVHFCLYQERSTSEVQDKLIEMECPDDFFEQIIGFLKKERYLDDKRFAYEYCYGKFKIKRWGKNKIRRGLQKHKIATQMIEQALNEAIDFDEYLRDN